MRSLIITVLLIGALLVACQDNGEESVVNDTPAPAPTAESLTPTPTEGILIPDEEEFGCGQICVPNILEILLKEDGASPQLLELLPEYGAYRDDQNLNLGPRDMIVWVPEENLEDLLTRLRNHPEVEYAHQLGSSAIDP